MQGLVYSKNPIISALAYWGTKTRQSVTGRNVANIWSEFEVNPLFCNTTAIIIKKKEVPDQGQENMELLERLLISRAEELEPDVLTELEGLISNVCAQ